VSWLKRFNDRLNAKAGVASAAPVSPSTHRIPDPLRDPPGTPPRRLTDTERLGYDAVNLPDHYKKFKIEPIRFCQENGLDANQTAIIKYVTRFRDKNGTEDLKKAARMLDMLIAFEEGDPDWWRLPGERASRRTYIV
jgi:hypothetical protein